MFSIGQYVLHGVMIFTAIWIAYKYLNTFGEKKKQNVLGLCAWLLYGIYQFAVEYYRDTPSIWKLIFGILLIYLVALFNYSWERRNCFFAICQFYVVWAIIEMIVFVILKSIANDEVKEEVIGVIISKIIMIIAVNIVSRHINGEAKDMISFKYYLFLLFVPLGSIYIAHVLFAEGITHTFSGMIAFSVLLLLNIIIFEIHDQLAEIARLEKEKVVYEQQIEIISRNTEEQKRIREEFHTERHNWNNELIVLKRCVENCDKKTILEEMDRIIKVNTDGNYVYNSGNEIVDAIINVKHIVAKEYGIVFNCKIFVPERLPVKQSDIGIVLGNAIDNAIDAVKECKNSDKIIDIFIGIKKESIVMSVKNPYEHKLIKDRSGRYLSTKDNKGQHGYGLKSIYKVAEKYGGEVVIYDYENYFTIMIFMNLPQN